VREGRPATGRSELRASSGDRGRCDEKRTAWWSLHNPGRDISPGDPRRGRRGIADQRRRVARRPATGLRSRWYERGAKTRVAAIRSRRRRSAPRAGGATHRQLPTLVEKAKHMVAFSTRFARGSKKLSSKASRRVSAPRRIGRGSGLCNSLSSTKRRVVGGPGARSSRRSFIDRGGRGRPSSVSVEYQAKRRPMVGSPATRLRFCGSRETPGGSWRLGAGPGLRATTAQQRSVDSRQARCLLSAGSARQVWTQAS
jgi:hypothetical protein